MRIRYVPPTDGVCATAIVTGDTVSGLCELLPGMVFRFEVAVTLNPKLTESVWMPSIDDCDVHIVCIYFATVSKDPMECGIDGVHWSDIHCLPEKHPVWYARYGDEYSERMKHTVLGSVQKMLTDVYGV